MKTLPTFLVLFLLALAPATLVADEIELSDIDKKKTDARRDAFSEWMSSNVFENYYEEQKLAGKFILYIEDNGKSEYRGIFGEVNPKGWYYYFGTSEETIYRVHREKTAAGMKLLTLSKGRGDRYSGVWVTDRTFAEVSAQLEKYGIGVAKIGE